MLIMVYLMLWPLRPATEGQWLFVIAVVPSALTLVVIRSSNFTDSTDEREALFLPSASSLSPSCLFASAMAEAAAGKTLLALYSTNKVLWNLTSELGRLCYTAYVTSQKQENQSHPIHTDVAQVCQTVAIHILHLYMVRQHMWACVFKPYSDIKAASNRGRLLHICWYLCDMEAPPDSPTLNLCLRLFSCMYRRWGPFQLP